MNESALWSRNIRRPFKLIYTLYLTIPFFLAVVISDAIFVLGLMDITRITISGPFVVIWLLAYILFVAETYLSLSLERGEGTRLNFFLTVMMYFTYSQLWLILVFKAAFLLLKRLFSKDRSFHWYKTERSSR